MLGAKKLNRIGMPMLDPTVSPPYAGRPMSVETPALGAGLDVASTATHKPSFFGQGGTGRAIAGNLGDALMQMSGMRPIYAPAMQQRQERADMFADEERKTGVRRAERAETMNAPKFFENAAGDYVKFDPSTGHAGVVYDGPDKAVTPTALEQQIALYRRLDPTATDTDVAALVKRGISGAQYDPSVYQPMTDYRTAAALRVKTAAPGKAASSGGGGGGRPRAAPKPPSGFILD